MLKQDMKSTRPEEDEGGPFGIILDERQRSSLFER